MIDPDMPIQPDGKVETVETNILRLQPGDTLVFKFPQKLTDDQRVKILALLRKNILEPIGFAESVALLILDDGIDLEVVRPEKI